MSPRKMSVQLSSYKRMLTQHCNKLEAVIARSRELERLRASEDDRTPGHERDCRKRIEEGLGIIEACTLKIEQVWQSYGCALDKLANPSKSEVDDYESYSAQAEAALSSAFDLTVVLEGQLRAFTSMIGGTQGTRGSPTSEQALQDYSAGTKKMELPTLPIPVFTGNIWDWDNFWVLFSTNVHSQPLPPLFKFNYLLNALKGEAYNAVKKFQITEGNYQKAIDFLKAKYGNKEELINRLIDRLENTEARSSAIKDQRVLLEKIQVIVGQLRDKGEQVDGQMLLKQVLSKFTDRLQRRVLEKKYSTEGSFHMETLLGYLDDVISSEEKIALYTSKNTASPADSKNERNYREQLRRGKGYAASNKTCMYCEESHRSGSCVKYGTPQERAKYLREHKLCFICASPQHPTSQCKGRLCFVCQGRHHTSCCFKSGSSERANRESPKKSSSSTPTTLKDKGKPTQKTQPSSTTNHQVSQGATVLHNEAHERSNSESAEIFDKRETYLPTGELTVMDPSTKQLRKVPVLLDSGAEFSFIDEALAEELRLPTLVSTTLRIRTFGSDRVQECLSRKVPLEIWDSEGRPYSLELLTHKSLTTTLKTPPILEEDIAFIRSLQVPINLIRGQQTTKPLILLGSDQLWQLLSKDQTHIRLPSGLHLLPTHLGHLVTGQVRQKSLVTQVVEDIEDLEERFDEGWDPQWAMEARVNAFSTETVQENADEKALWEKYWSLEQEGTEEFAIPEKEVQSLIDKKVLEDFKNTIEKKDDGYYVRLPWKEIPVALPDNRAIAWRRLMSVWTTLQKDKELLQKYNSIFEEQLRLNIIEEVTDERQSDGGIVHYLPHQAVLTPQKNTTKVRIVFDASAHFKNSPSLNDALHRGPIILPKLFGILLRFRIGRVALISDVEKAFLQIRVQPVDRDATRCLWLYDHKAPPSPSNLRIFRFTRVTFGLLPSPFLLAATTHYHLDQYPNDTILVKEIKENLYVDNLLLTMDTQDEATRVYSRTKAIFSELKMNLREFVSNQDQVMQNIAEEDRSAERDPKVLGVKWFSFEDELEIACHIAEQSKITKRTVTSTIASVYDPMGWLLPLVLRAKIFLQSLWRDELEWDEPLPEDRKIAWEALIKSMDGFQKRLPRFLVSKFSTVQLVTFADASSDAMAACIYLCSSQSANLLMAKGKLPSLKAKMTIPKMELSALTLAMRLTNSVLAQIASIISVTKIIILSDSEIVLNWIRTKPRPIIGPFIRNRVLEVRNIVAHLVGKGYKIEFGHIPSQSNPADCATRGLDKTLLRDHCWWKGPGFLTQAETWKDEYAPVTLETSQDSEESETDQAGEDNAMKVHTLTRTKDNHTDLFQNIRFSAFTSIKRVVAYVMRFIRIVVNRVNTKRTASIKLTAALEKGVGGQHTTIHGWEMGMSNVMLVKQHQISHLNNEIRKSLHRLNLYEDQYGVWRCRGRLGKSELDDSAKFPMLVLQKSWLAQRIIEDCHSALHLSTSHTMGKVRETYWIPQLRAEVTKVVRRCVRCQKLSNLPYKYPEQSHLPARRVMRSRPFAHVGLDYFGPLSVKNEDRIDKCYGCIITCLVTRLVHLDVVADNSTIAFLQMLRRFFSRRGNPLSITSDNSPTFALGETILSECYQRIKKDTTIEKEVSNRQIDWIYITPYAPWQGGVYERLIQSVKLALHKALGKTIPTRGELDTLIVEIEGMMNTRPLLYVESDTVSDRVLRPIDFLQNEFEVPPPLEIEEEDTNDPMYATPAERVTLQTKMQVLQALRTSCQMTEKFWQIWHSQYITSLREKHQRNVGKRRGSRLVPETGKIVLICDALQPRYQWKMGRIVELIKNKEGTTREAIVQLPSHRKIRRPINLLTPLELAEDDPASEGKTSSQRKTEEVPASAEDPNMDHDIEEPRTSPYNLRQRKKVNYNENAAVLSMNTKSVLLVTIISVLLGICAGFSDASAGHINSNVMCERDALNVTLGSTIISRTLYLSATFIRDEKGTLARDVQRNCGGKYLHLLYISTKIFIYSTCKVTTAKTKYLSVEFLKTCTCYFRMAERNSEDDTKYLSNLILKRHTALNRVQDDLGAIYEVFQQQISIASMAQLQWNYTKTEESFVLGTPASRIKTIAKQMKDLMVAREKMSRMGTRFIYTNRYYKEVAHLGDQHPNVSVQEWDRQAESALLQLEKNKKRFDEVIKEMEVEMEQAEKDFNVGPCHTNAQHINTLFRRAFENLTATDKDNSEKRFADVQEKLKEQSDEILRLKNIVEKSGVGNSAKDDTNEMNDDVYFSRMVDEVRVVNDPGPIQDLPALASDGEDSNGEGDVHSVTAEENERMDTDEPLEEPNSSRNRERVVEELPPDRIVEIVHEGRDSDRAPEIGGEDHSRARRRSPSRPRRDRNDQRRRELRWRINELEERRDWMERDLRDFPYRKKESRSPYMNPSLNCAFCDREGEHFSDSCPNVVNGDRRWEIMRDRSLCQYCLKRCGYYEDCAYRRKGCYYCNRVKGTAFEFLIPDDRGHHTALCNIPDRRNEARRQTEEVREELRHLIREYDAMDAEARRDA